MSRSIVPLVSVLAVLLSSVAGADESSLSIDTPYVRLVPPNAPASGAFMVIRNSGKELRRLVSAESNAAKTVELHTHINDNGLMKMRAVPSIDIASGGAVELKPGSYHVMLIGLHKPLAEGDLIPISLGFDDGQKIKVSAPVRKIEVPMAGAHAGHGDARH